MQTASASIFLREQKLDEKFPRDTNAITVNANEV